MKLFINTCSRVCQIFLFEDKLIDSLIIETNRNMTEIINSSLEDFIKRNKISYHDITDLYLTIGPGSFTGIKVGITLAKAWKLAIANLNIYTISTLLLQATEPNCYSLIDARSQKHYLAEIHDYKINGNFTLIEDSKIFDLFNKNNIIIKDTIDKVDFNNVKMHLKNFEKVKDLKNLNAIYIKGAI